jgi:hypothetical protein
VCALVSARFAAAEDARLNLAVHVQPGLRRFMHQVPVSVVKQSNRDVAEMVLVERDVAACRPFDDVGVLSPADARMIGDRDSALEESGQRKPTSSRRTVRAGVAGFVQPMVLRPLSYRRPVSRWMVA